MSSSQPPPPLPSFTGRLTALRAMRFDPEKMGDLRDLVVPPGASVYLDGDMSEAGVVDVRHLFPHPLDPTHGPADPSRRSRIAQLYADWRAQGHLRWDPRPGVYAHRLIFTDAAGERAERWGFYLLLAIGPHGAIRVLPHEQTLPDRVQKQLDIFSWRGAQILPLFMLYSDPTGDVMRGILDRLPPEGPELHFTDTLGQENDLWLVGDEALAAEIDHQLADKELLLADGHHRFEASRAYWRALRESGGPLPPGVPAEDPEAGPPPEAYAVAYLTPAEGPGLRMGTFHRGVRALEHGIHELGRRLAPLYDVEHLPMPHGVDLRHRAEEELARQHRRRTDTGDGRARFVLIDRQMDGLYLVTRRTPAAGGATSRLDVTDFHEGLLPLLGPRGGIEFEQEPQVLLAALGRGELDLVCLSDAPSMDDVWAVARSRVPMPPKATYFYPKLPAGLLHFPLAPVVFPR